MAAGELGASVPLDGERRVPIVEVAFRHGKWWQIPLEMSQMIYEKYLANEDAGYTWDWGDTREGSWQGSDGKGSTINRNVDADKYRQREDKNLSDRLGPAKKRRGRSHRKPTTKRRGVRR